MSFVSALGDGAVVAKRNVIKIKRVPEILVFVLLSPIMFVLLFAFVFGGAIDVAGGSYREFLIAGILAQTVVFGATFTGANTTRNVGTLAAPASRDRYLLSRDKARDGADVALAPRRAVGPLAPNEQSFGSVAVKVPSTTATGLYWLLVCADDTGLVAEANEADNCRTATTQLRITN